MLGDQSSTPVDDTPEHVILFKWEHNGEMYHAHSDGYPDGVCYIFICKLIKDSGSTILPSYWSMQGEVDSDSVRYIADLPALALRLGFADQNTKFVKEL